MGIPAYSQVSAPNFILRKYSAKPNSGRYVDFAMNRIRMLLYFGIVPYVVFDGGNLPSKAATEEARAAKREYCRKVGLTLLDNGRKAEAYRELQGAIDVTPSMARLFIEELRKLNISYVVAPYEADAQLVYLESRGLIDGIISEDSDMLVFGAKRLISKLDRHGDCIELDRADFAACRDVSLAGWTDADFRAMCILSGCDYLQNIPGMGLKTAYRYIRKHKTVERVVQMLRFENKSAIPQAYLNDFKRAEFTFLYQRVFCPDAQRLVTLRPVPPDLDIKQLNYIGDDLEPEIAKGVAVGDLHPTTKELIDLPQSLPPTRNPQPNRSHAVSSESFKKPSPITTFFTPKRLPLTTLDNNILTPTESQQDLLRRNMGRSWSANAVLTHANSPNSLQKPVTVSPDDVRRSLASNSAAQIGKRLRDFSDSPGGESEIETPSKETVEIKSRYFANIQPIHKVAKAGDNQAAKRTKTSEEADQATISDDNRKASLDVSLETSEVHSGCEERLTSVNDLSPSGTDALQDHMKVQNLKLHERYGYGTSSDKQIHEGGKTQGGQAAATSSSGQGHLLPPRANKPIPRAASANYITQRTTPLQRLKRMALARSRSLNSLSSSSKPVPEPRVPPEKRTILTQSVIHRGSEDMIVPGSDDDEDCPSPERMERKEKTKSLLNLEEFIFVPRDH
ncbi:Rad2 nuclease [Ascosphaera pollenicola]|nr:Rad2 nuclease [Ascosphaera pollenicola]